MKFFSKLLFLIACFSSFPAYAQITTDGTTSTTITPTINGVQIDDGDRAGNNLFHSFGEFSVDFGSEAYFNNAGDIVNIFSRVTGGNISNINGLISANGTANLFLINPAGIVFGDGARLQLGGSFYGSTADSIVFGNGEFSSTDLTNPPLITVNAPIGLGFRERDNPGIITVFGDGFGKRFTTDLIDTENALRVNENSTLGLIGGEINLNGATLKTPGGRIELGSVSGNQIVDLISTNKGFGFGYESVTSFDNINLLQVSNLDASGLVNGDIKIHGNNLNLIEGSVIEASTIGIADNSLTPGAIELDAVETITVDGEEFFNGSSSFILNQVYPSSVGDAGGVIINAGSVGFFNGGQIVSSTFGRGNSGNVTINATDTVTFDGLDLNFFPSGIISFVGDTAVGNAGDITIAADSLFLIDGAQISASTFGSGNAGSIFLTATNAIALDGDNALVSDIGVFSIASDTAVGNAGNITISTGSLNLSNGAQINTRTLGNGNAGSIAINANETIEINGNNRFSLSGIFSTVESSAIGNAGDITIDTGSLNLSDGAQIDAGTLAQGNAGSISLTATDTITFDGDNSLSVEEGNFISISGAFSIVESGAIGDAGNIRIETATLNLFNGAQISSSVFGSGNGGAIAIKAAETVNLESENGFASGIFSTFASEILGQTGNIEIETNSLNLLNGGQINASTSGFGNAGNIKIEAIDTVVLNGEDAEGNAGGFFSDVNAEATGNGGNIKINAASLGVSNGSLIGTSTFGRGNAGNIKIEATNEVIFDEGLGFVTGAFSNVLEGIGNAGAIDITTNTLKLFNGSQISTNTNGLGNAAPITIDANEIILDFRDRQGGSSGILTTVREFGEGNAGSIDISTDSLTILNGAQITSASFGRGNAGKIEIDASNVSIDGTNTFTIVAEDRTILTNSGIFSDVGIEFDRSFSNAGIGNGGDINLKANNLSLTNGGQINASTSGIGNTGSIEIDINETIALDGSDSGIFSAVEELGRGNAASIGISANSLKLNNGAQIAASTSGKGNAGSIDIVTTKDLILDGEGSSKESVTGIFSTVAVGAIANTEIAVAEINLTTASLNLINGGQISASTFGRGSAGTIDIEATNRVTIDRKINNNNTSGIFSIIDRSAIGNAGNIKLKTNLLSISNEGQIDIRNDSLAEDIASGIIEIEATSINLNKGNITASTQSGTGGEIKLNLTEDLTLRNNSLISARAFNEANGGNLEIDARFIFAFPSNGFGSNLIANAERGNGGEIEISAEQIFNLREEKAISGNENLIENNANNIDASSEFGLNGLVVIDTVDNNPFRETQELSSDLVSAEIVTASDACSISDIDRVSSLIINGKGGITPNPTDYFNSDALIISEETKVSRIDLENNLIHHLSSVKPVAYKSNGEAIYLARGIVKDKNGTVMLTAFANRQETNRNLPNSYSCQ